MTAGYNQGILLPSAVASQLPKTQFGIAQLWFVNRNPLVSRLAKAPVGNVSFSMVGYKFRPRLGTLSATVGSGDTTITVTDYTPIMNGDVILLSSGEAVEVAATPTSSAVPVRRGIGTAFTGFAVVGATAIASIAGSAATFKILGNSRSGGEINQSAIQQLPSSVIQYVQTYQHVVQVSGIMQDIQGYPWPGNAPAPFPKNKLDAMQNLMDDIEVSSLYGIGENGNGNLGRYKQYGLCNLIQTNSVSSPTNASAYKPSDFVGDCLKPIWKNGGRPSVIFASSSFMTGLAVWGGAITRMSPGTTIFGVDIDVFYSPFVGSIPIVPSMWLNDGEALILTEEEVRFRVMKEPVYEMYGRRGDTGSFDNNGEGDWIGRLAIELDNEFHHAHVSNITGFAPATS